MEAGTIPSNWDNLVKYSSEMATAQDVNLADTWPRLQSNEEASDPLSDTFVIVTDCHKHQKTNTSGSASDNKDIPILASEGDKLNLASSPTSQPMNQPAYNSFANAQSMSNNGRSGVQIDTFNSNSYSDPSSHNYYTQSLTIPTRLNPSENGLRQSIRLRKLR